MRDKSTDARRDHRSVKRVSNPMAYEALRLRDISSRHGRTRRKDRLRPSLRFCRDGEVCEDRAAMPPPEQYDLFMGRSWRGNQFRPDWRTEHALQTGRQPLEPLPALLMLFSRALLLWILIPLGFAAWVLGSPWFLLKHVSLGQFLGWLDLNLCVALQRGPLRPFIAKPRVKWIPGSKMHQTEHRIRMLDLW